MKPSPEGIYLLNCKQNNVLFQIFAMHTVPEGSKVTVTWKKIDGGETVSTALLDTEQVNRPYKQVYVENEPHIRSKGPKNSNLATFGNGVGKGQ